MPKIIVISTGGTIGSAADGGKISLLQDDGVISRFCRRFDIDDSLFEYRRVLNVLSENMQLTDLQRLVDCLFELLDSPAGPTGGEYSGIIITHGTDTLAFTASLLGIIFAHVRIPVLITGSNLPLSDDNTDAFDNLKLCWDFIRLGLPGVYAAFGGKVHLSTRIGQALHFVHDYPPLAGVPLAVRDGDGIKLIDSPANPGIDEIRAERPSLFKPPIGLGKIMLIRPYTGLDYTTINIYSGCCDAVLHGTYHSGSVDSSGGVRCDNTSDGSDKGSGVLRCGKPSLGVSAPGSQAGERRPNGSNQLCGIFSLAERCAYARIPLFLGPVDAGRVYSGQEKVRGSGVIPFSGIPLITAWAKLTAGIKFFDNIRNLTSFINTDIFFERI